MLVGESSRPGGADVYWSGRRRTAAGSVAGPVAARCAGIPGRRLVSRRVHGHPSPRDPESGRGPAGPTDTHREVIWWRGRGFGARRRVKEDSHGEVCSEEVGSEGQTGGEGEDPAGR